MEVESEVVRESCDRAVVISCDRMDQQGAPDPKPLLTLMRSWWTLAIRSCISTRFLTSAHPVASTGTILYVHVSNESTAQSSSSRLRIWILSHRPGPLGIVVRSRRTAILPRCPWFHHIVEEVLWRINIHFMERKELLTHFEATVW